MFDSYHSHSRTEYVDRHIKIDEHRAPTDKSIEILQEMEKKVRKEFVKSFLLDSNTFIANISIFKDDVGRATIIITYQMNFVFKEIVLNIDPTEYSHGGEDYIQKLAQKAISKDIASTLTMNSERIASYLYDKPEPQSKSTIRLVQDRFSLDYYGSLHSMDWSSAEDTAVKLTMIKHWISRDRKLKELLEDVL